MTDAIAALIEGVRAFRRAEYPGGRHGIARLAKGQQPEVMMFGCSDSRVDPALVCGAGPGEVFLVRNVANLVPPYDLRDPRGDGVRAALEYGVRVLGVSHIVVLGHSDCGGVRGMIDIARGSPPELEFIAPWLSIADRVCDRLLAELAENGEPEVTADELPARSALVERRSILNSLDNLRSYPWVRDGIESGGLAVHGWWLDLHDGRLWVFHPETGTFLPIEAV